MGETENYRIAGGAQSSARESVNFLQMIINEGNHKGAQIDSKQSVQEIQKDQTFGVPIIETSYENYAYLDRTLPETRYDIGQWIERKDSLSGESFELSSQGAFGFSPWIDLERNLVCVLSVKSILSRVVPTYLELKKQIRAAIDSVSSPSSVKEHDQVTQHYCLYQNYPNPFRKWDKLTWTFCLKIKLINNDLRDSGGGIIELFYFNFGFYC